jgi:hypothetical protein
MLELIVCIVMAKPPQAPPLLSVIQAPPVDCHEVGDVSPTLKREMNVRSPKPMGDGWTWNAEEQCWQRVIKVVSINNPSVIHSTPTMKYYPQPVVTYNPVMSSGIPFLSGGNCGPRG